MSVLSNPTKRQAVEEARQDETANLEQAQNLNDQLSFEADSRQTRVSQRLTSARIKIKQRRLMMELSPLWANPAIPFAVVTFLFGVVLMFFIVVIRYNDISPLVPFFYNSVDESWIQVQRQDLLVFPIIFIGLFLILMRLVFAIAYKDKKLAVMIAWVLTFVNILLILNLSKLYGLIF